MSDLEPPTYRVTLLLADAAQVSDGKLYVLGGGLRVIGPNPQPAAIAMLIEVPWDRANVRHEWKLELLSEDGMPIMHGERPVIVGGEFGRTPMSQQKSNDDKPNAQPGRDHHKDAFCVWMAGGGVKRGATYGETDDFGFNIVRDPMHVNDYHATLLHLLGLDHEKLTFKFQGRNFRLTDVAGKVAKPILA